MSFVANDYGEACYSYYLRTCDAQKCKTAREQFEHAKALNPDAILPYYNLYLLYMHEELFEEAHRELDGLRKLEPSWSDVLLAGIAARADAASKKVSRPAPPEDVSLEGVEVLSRTRVGDIASRPKKSSDWPLLDDLRRLVPHTWLWPAGPRSRRAFRWRVFWPWRRRFIRWDEQFDELHVQAVFKWALGRLAYDSVRGKGLARLRHSNAAAVLSCIERYFWPGNFALLFTLLQLERAEDRKRRSGNAVARNTIRDRQENLQALVTRWLAESPTSFWALELVVTDFVDFDQKPLELFQPGQRIELLENAQREIIRKGSPSSAPLATWIEERLEEERQKQGGGMRAEAA